MAKFVCIFKVKFLCQRSVLSFWFLKKALLKAAKIFRIAPAGDNNVVQPLKLCLGGSTTTTSASSSQSNNQRKRHRQDSDSSYSSICTFIYLSIYFLLLLQSNFDKMNIKSSITNWWSNFTLYQFDSKYSRNYFIEGFVWLLRTIFQEGQVYVKYLLDAKVFCQSKAIGKNQSP